ncbi:UNVERIFIED_CONTAM: hypothetical protein Slati_3819600 [Sesamum latifolium]|uniref:Uncharacterized protein n=1 Tax=Sesamum latifolium TaxID=2727402 RepID=A0AAW2U590_9LAMI
MAENAKLKNAKKEVVGRYQQAEKEVKKLQRELTTLEDQSKEIRKATDLAMLDFPHTDEGREYLEGYWESHLLDY